MTLSLLFQWIVAHPWEFLGRIAAASMAFAAAWASVKAAVQKVTGRAMPRNALTTTLDVLAELAMNIPGAINRWVRAGGSPSLFAPPSRDTVVPPPPSDPQRGAVRVGALLAICGGVLLATLAGAVLTGCPRPRDCTPASQRCEGDTPVICDGEGRSWRASGDPIVTCAQVGGVCLVRDGRAFCGRAPADAGAASDGGAL